MSGNNAGGSGKTAGGGTQTLFIMAAVAAMAAGAYYQIKQDRAETGELGGGPSPDYIHRGAAAFFNIAANAPPAASSDVTKPYVTGATYPLTDTCNTTDLNASKVYAVIRHHFGLSVDCGGSAYVATLGGTEIYYAFTTVAGALHGHAIYFPKRVGDPKEAVLFSKPK